MLSYLVWDCIGNKQIIVASYDESDPSLVLLRRVGDIVKYSTIYKQNSYDRLFEEPVLILGFEEKDNRVAIHAIDAYGEVSKYTVDALKDIPFISRCFHQHFTFRRLAKELAKKQGEKVKNSEV